MKTKDDIKRVFERINKLRSKGKLPPINLSSWDNEPTALAFTPYDNGFSSLSPNAYYRRDDLYRAFLVGHKMGLLGIDELQLDAEFIMFKNKLDSEDEDY